MKRLVSVISVLLILLQLCSVAAFAVNDSGSPKHIPRVVSVVFDDSGSMYNKTDRWAYTSYAMQSFVAMMGSEDVLYVTYINAASDPVRIDLSDSGKQKTIDNVEKTVFGGGTDNKLEKAADCLTKEYNNYGADAKYYYIVMADGELDEGEMSTELKSEVEELKDDLEGVDFEAIYFSMKEGDSLSLADVTTKTASSGNQIVSVLREISADIMGRTTLDFKSSGGKLSFTLKYPALNIAVFVQKENNSFSNVNVPVYKDGKAASYHVNTYYVDCPTKIVKNQNHTKYEERIPTSPPSGFVSLIGNGNNSLPKGEYTIDLSAYGVGKNNVVIMVEPAVKIGCQYFRGDSETPISFSELNKNTRVGDKIVVKCGLYEINSDGSLGDPIPLDVLSPNYSLYINDKEIGTKLSGAENKYEFTVDKSFEDQDLKVEAVLKGYQPFVIREQFGSVSVKPSLNQNSGSPESEALTKPLWSGWINGTQEITFALSEISDSMLDNVSIKVEGADFLPSGKCSKLIDNVRVSGNNIIYTPTVLKDIQFKDLPKSFKISLCDDVDNSVVSTVTVTVIQPQYKIEIQNGLGTSALNLSSLKTNTNSVKFKLLADYDGSGNFGEANLNNCEKEIKLTLDSGNLTGNVSEAANEISFTPLYDVETNTEVKPDMIIGKEHIISATAVVDGATVKSENISLKIGRTAYKIVIENPISTPLTLDTIKGNNKKITFSILADYSGDGNYVAVEEWDNAIYEKLKINAGELPGSFRTEYDGKKNPVGKSFIPSYDENNNKGVVFTKVAGKVHKIAGTLESYDVSAETTVEVLAPIYEIKVQKGTMELVDTKLLKNTEGVEFIITRNGRVLSAEELESLESYEITLSPEQKWMAIDVSVKTTDAKSYLFCKPSYNGWRFISPKLWCWVCLFAVDKDDTTLTLTMGQNSASAVIDISQDTISLIILLIIIAVLVLIIFTILCLVTRIRFEKGFFYIVEFSKSGLDYVVTSVIIENARKSGIYNFFRQFFDSFKPKNLKKLRLKSPLFSEQTKTINVDGASAKFTTQRDPVDFWNTSSYPFIMSENSDEFETGSLKEKTVGAIVRQETEIKVSGLSTRKIGKTDERLYPCSYLKKKDANIVILFVSKEERKAFYGS